VDFRDCKLLEFYDEPEAGAILAAKHWKLATPEAALDKILAALRDSWAPPFHNRYVNVQEVETVLCKWKAHCNGYYEIGKDTSEVVHGLQNYSSKTGDLLLRTLEAQSPILKKKKARALV
jgi:hypothetical protein